MQTMQMRRRRVRLRRQYEVCLFAAFCALMAAHNGDAQEATVPAPDLASNIGRGLAQSPWPRFGGGAGNTGNVTSGSVAALPWTVAIYAKHHVGPPAIGADGSLYITGDTLYALDGATGRNKWKITSLYSLAVGAVLDNRGGLYYCGARDTEVGRAWGVYALNSASGKARWTLPLRHASTSTPALGANGLLYVQCVDGDLVALNSATGKCKWTFTLKESIFTSKEIFTTFLPVVLCSPALGPDGTVYSSYDRLYAVDGATGQPKWVFGIADGAVGNSPAVGPDGTVYVGGSRGKAGQVTALDGATGRQKWAFATSASTLWNAPALGADGTLYVGAADGGLYALNARTGTLKWRFEGQSDIMCPAVIGSDGTVYFGGRGGDFHALDGRTGQQKWAVRLPQGLSYGCALGGNGLIYVPTVGGTIYALNAADGAMGKPPLFPQ